ncbi:MAG: T9SS type A sorting domain-containing protein [Bacteroidales bacterium]|nr:T9SS type A sorting domain-containing protein [Bacteroidales bacterium]
MKSILLILSFLFLTTTVFAQEWLQEPYYSPSDEGNTFENIDQAFNTWAADKDLSQVKGWKSFKRWHWFYKQRAYNGDLPNAKYILKEKNEFDSKYGSYRGNANWVSISPSYVPTCSDTSNITGMGRVNCIAFHPTDTNTIFAGTSQGGAWKSTDNGATWISLTDNLPVLRISDIAIDPIHPDTMYLATGDIDHIVMSLVAYGGTYEYGMGVLRSYDGGITWDSTGLIFDATAEENSLLRKVVINTDSAGYLLTGGSAGMWRSTDYGDNWTQTLTGEYTDIEVNPLNPNQIFVARLFIPGVPNSRAAVYRSNDFGLTWTELPTGILPFSAIYRTELAIAPSDTNTVYAISCRSNGGFYGFYRSQDNGDTWTQESSYTGTNKAPNMLGWADGGYFGFTFPGVPADDNGQGTYDLTLLVHPNNKDLVYTGGVNMWASTNGGQGGDSSTWNVVSFWLKYFGRSIHADQHFSAFHPLTGDFYQGTDGGIYTADTLVIGNLDNVLPCLNFTTFEIIPGCYTLETQWQDISAGIHANEYYRIGLCRAKDDMVIGGTQDNGTFLFNNGTWIQTFGGDGMEAFIHHDNPDTMWATNYNGTLSRSYDGGQNYVSSLEQPMTDAGETGDWVTPFAQHPYFSNEIFAGFKNVWKSTDLGDTWTKISSFSTTKSLTSLAISPTNPGYIYAANSSDIYKTTDAGATWVSIRGTLPMSQAFLTYIAADSYDPEKIYVTFSGFETGKKVYMTEDAGTTWTNISENLPNVPFNCIVHQSGLTAGGDTINGLYAGSDIGVFYTNDSLMQTATPWIMYTTGMPSVVVTELEIQYHAQKIVAATYGRGIWESPLYSDSYNANVGIEEAHTAMLVYPNPSEGLLHIAMKEIQGNDIKWIVFDLQGRINASGKASTKEFSIDISNLPSGNYLLHVENANTQYRTMISKQ